MSGLDVVTGAYGYTGRYIAQLLLGSGRTVRTLTNHPGSPDLFGGRVPAAPLAFGDPAAMARSLEGAEVLYNTYWVRFPRGATTFAAAVENTRTLMQAALSAGVRRMVHVSITNPSEDSPFPYFRGKAAIERAILESGISYGIVRPTVIFGHGDVLINNVAWLLRHSPVFLIPGSGSYRLQPIFVEDLAEICVDAGRASGNLVIDAAGPETFTFEGLVGLLRRALGSHAVIAHGPPWLALNLSRLLGLAVRDRILTRDELGGLMAGLVASGQPPRGHTRLSTWADERGPVLGQRWASELGRHYRS